jgi:uncharacterized protein YecE (DUF72 family)
MRGEIMAEQGRVLTGMAGWVYAPWRASFYPEGLKQKEELNYASRHVGAIEINATFRSFQSPDSFARWAGETPDGFVFAIKGHQVVTHFKRLVGVEAPLADFFASGVLKLGAKLGPICWQLPDTLKFDAERVEAFLSLLPQDGPAAERLAAGNSGRLRHPPALEATGIGPVRHALEVRHESFRDSAFVALMRKYNVAMVVADTADWPLTDLTADFAYCRLQGPPGGDHYDEAGLEHWAQTVSAWAAGKTPPDAPLIAPPAEPRPRDVYCFFVRTDKEHAPMNAMATAERARALAAGR